LLAFLLLTCGYLGCVPETENRYQVMESSELNDPLVSTIFASNKYTTSSSSSSLVSTALNSSANPSNANAMDSEANQSMKISRKPAVSFLTTTSSSSSSSSSSYPTIMVTSSVKMKGIMNQNAQEEIKDEENGTTKKELFVWPFPSTGNVLLDMEKYAVHYLPIDQYPIIIKKADEDIVVPWTEELFHGKIFYIEGYSGNTNSNKVVKTLSLLFVATLLSHFISLVCFCLISLGERLSHAMHPIPWWSDEYDRLSGSQCDGTW